MLTKLKRLIRDFQEFRMLQANLEIDVDLSTHIARLQQRIRTLELRLNPLTKWGLEQPGWEQIEPGFTKP